MNRAPDLVLPSPAGLTNVRLVVVDVDRQPAYVVRAAELESQMLTVASAAGVEPADMPGLHGLCVEAVRAAERRGR